MMKHLLLKVLPEAQQRRRPLSAVGCALVPHDPGPGHRMWTGLTKGSAAVDWRHLSMKAHPRLRALCPRNAAGYGGLNRAVWKACCGTFPGVVKNVKQSWEIPSQRTAVPLWLIMSSPGADLLVRAGGIWYQTECSERTPDALCSIRWLTSVWLLW